MSRDEVLKHVQTFAEVRGNRRFNDRTVRLGHQTTHTSELTNLGSRTTRARVGHHVNRIEGFLSTFGSVTTNDVFNLQLLHHRLADFITGFAPDVDHFVIALAGSHQTGRVLLFDLFNFLFCSRNQRGFLWWYQHVIDANRNTGARRETETRLHQLVSKDGCRAQTALAERDIDELGDLFLFQRTIDRTERQTFRQNFGKNRATNCRFIAIDRLDEFTGSRIFRVLSNPHRDTRGQFDFFVVIGTNDFRNAREHHAFTFGIDFLAGRVVQTEHNILRWNDRWLAVRWEQNVVRRQHQRTRLHLRFDRQRYVNRHLVTIEVGVEGRANERMQLDCFAFDQHRLESLNTKTVQGWCTVEHDRVFTNHVFEDVPDHRLLHLDQLLCGLNGGCQTHQLKLIEDERLEQFERHQLRQTALVQFQLRTNHNNRTTRVVDALAQQVLTETTAFTLDHFGQRFQRTLVRTRHRLAATTVIEQRVNRFLQHALFVARDDFRRAQFHQPLQTIITIDHAAIQIVQI